MDYILNKINKKISYLASTRDYAELRIYSQVRIEYLMIKALAYLWNECFERMNIEEKQEVFGLINAPTVGQILHLIRKLQAYSSVSFGKKPLKILNDYPMLRNQKIGHGYVFEDATQEMTESLKRIYEQLVADGNSFFAAEYDLIKVEHLQDGMYKGIRFDPQGNYSFWVVPEDYSEFELGSCYVTKENGHFVRISPFVHIEDDDEFYVFSRIKERLTGNIQYNRIMKTGEFTKNWQEIKLLNVESDGIRKVTSNGTVINIYENNFKKYIDIGVKSKILSFLKDNKSSVCATIWGHGGVGKTATVQSICEDLGYQEKKCFDYVIFLSAKDRYYNYFTGQIESIDIRIDSYNTMIMLLNTILGVNATSDETYLVESSERILLILDDFETFTYDDRLNIKQLIQKLNVNHHKVLVTTRINDILGEEFQTNELSPNDTITFFKKVLENELPSFNAVLLEEELNDENLKHRIQTITSGRPLFILQLAFILGQKASLKEALNFDITSSQHAVDFLYGRIYDHYLSENAKLIFITISQLVNADDLGSLVDKIPYCINLENDSVHFQSALEELIKLKILKVDEDRRFFEVYSKEILQIMTDKFRAFSDGNQKRSIFQRLQQVNKNKSLDTEKSLLLNANASRLSKNEEEVISNYRQILNRVTSPQDVKKQACLNLAAYLIDRGKRNQALRFLDEYDHLFREDPLFIKMHSSYYWANGDREEKNRAIDILLNYYAVKRTLDYDLKSEIVGQLLTFKCMQLLLEWYDLKELKMLEKIPYGEFRKKRDSQIQECNTIHNEIGIKLLRYVESHKLDDFKPGARQQIITGLYQFIDICIRINKLPLAQEICEYMINCAPQHFVHQFRTKNDRINWMIFKNKQKAQQKNR